MIDQAKRLQMLEIEVAAARPMIRHLQDEIEKLERHHEGTVEGYAALTVEIDSLNVVRAAAVALLDDVRRRHPGESLRCEFMQRLSLALDALPPPASRGGNTE